MELIRVFPLRRHVGAGRVELKLIEFDPGRRAGVVRIEGSATVVRDPGGTDAVGGDHECGTKLFVIGGVSLRVQRVRTRTRLEYVGEFVARILKAYHA